MQEASKRRCNKIKLLSLLFVSKLISQKILVNKYRTEKALNYVTKPACDERQTPRKIMDFDSSVIRDRS